MMLGYQGTRIPRDTSILCLTHIFSQSVPIFAETEKLKFKVTVGLQWIA